MCEKMTGHCFTKDQKKQLTEKGWTTKQIEYAEESIIEEKIKELLN